MASTVHSKVGDVLTQHLAKVKAEAFNVHGHAMQTRFWPDILVWHPKWSGGIEIKIKSDQMSRGQWQRALRLIRNGCPVFVLRTNTVRGEWKLQKVTDKHKVHETVGVFKGEKELWNWLSTRYASSGIYQKV